MQLGSDFPKSYFLMTAGILLLGMAGGAYFGYQKNLGKTPFEEPGSQESSESLGGSKSLEKLAPKVPEGRGAVSGQDIHAPKQPPKPPASSLPPQPQQKSTPPKISICEQAQKELEKQKLAAQKVYDLEIAEVSRQLNELQRQRNEAINNYLTAIAIATSKYNSATSTSAYEIYQEEQSVALNSYTQAVTDIAAKETPLLETKKTSQTKYDEALSAAQTQYETKTAGQNCPAPAVN